MKKRILYITALTAIITPIFLTGTINPFICIFIHLFGIILFVFGVNRELRLMFVLLFLWFDLIFCFAPDMPPTKNRFSKAGITLSEDQKKKIRLECDMELYDSINHYLKYPPNVDAIKKLDLGNSSLRDTLSIAITIAEKNIYYATFFGILTMLKYINIFIMIHCSKPTGTIGEREVKQVKPIMDLWFTMYLSTAICLISIEN